MFVQIPNLSPFSVLHSPFSVLRSPFSVLRSPFSVLCSPFSVLRSLFSVLRSPFSVLRLYFRKKQRRRKIGDLLVWPLAGKWPNERLGSRSKESLELKRKQELDRSACDCFPVHQTNVHTDSKLYLRLGAYAKMVWSRAKDETKSQLGFQRRSVTSVPLPFVTAVACLSANRHQQQKSLKSIPSVSTVIILNVSNQHIVKDFMGNSESVSEPLRRSMVMERP